MANKWYMYSMMLISSAYINLCPLFNFLDQKTDLQMQIHTETQKYDASLAKQYQHQRTKEHRKSGILDQGKKITIHTKKKDIQTVSCSGYKTRCENVL